MPPRTRAPAGPRGRTGAAAEAAAAEYLSARGWTILARNIRIRGVELDIVARTPRPDGRLVVVEVRARSGPAFGSATESIDGRKVARLYRAALGFGPAYGLPRVDLVALRRTRRGPWEVEAHVRGLEPPG